MEEWRPVAECGCYEVSSLGNVRRVSVGLNGRKPGPVRPWVNRATGYLMATLHDGRRGTKRSVHRLVALAFLGAPPTPRHIVAHNDGSRANNRAVNLRWALPAENRADMEVHGTKPEGQKHGMAKLTEPQVHDIREACAAGERQRDVAQRFGVHQAQVHRIAACKSWKHLGRELAA